MLETDESHPVQSFRAEAARLAAPPLGPTRLLPFARPPQASGGTGSGGRGTQKAFYDKRHVFFEAASLIKYLFFFKKMSLGSNTAKNKKQRKEQAVSDFYLFVLTASLSEILFFPRPLPPLSGHEGRAVSSPHSELPTVKSGSHQT